MKRAEIQVTKLALEAEEAGHEVLSWTWSAPEIYFIVSLINELHLESQCLGRP